MKRQLNKDRQQGYCLLPLDVLAKKRYSMFQSSANAQQPIKDKQFIIYSSAAFLPIRCYAQCGKFDTTTKNCKK